MKKILILLSVVITFVGVTYADTWAPPVEKDYCSDNKIFIAHVKPAEKDIKCKLEVFEIKEPEKTLLWHCTLGNEGAPKDVFVTNDGRYVVTVNENSNRVHGGMGDFVLAFYSRDGLIKNYSLEQILHYPNNINQQAFERLTRRSVSGRTWASMPMFLDEYDGKLCFSLWLLYGQCWLAWEVSSGEEVKISDKLVERWNEKGRLWALEEGIRSQSFKQALEFLARLKKHEDRDIIESFLTSGDFYTWYEEGSGKFLRYYCWSPKRSIADSILAEWDGKPKQELSRDNQKYYFLGVVEGTLELPRPPKAGNHYLCIYLIPSTIAKSQWYNEVPVHRLTAYFGEYSFHNTQWPGRILPFRIQGVMPGKYWVTAVWDRAKPYNFEDNYITGQPQPGDYQSAESPIITVKAGEIIEGITIHCTQEVKSGTD
jgi:hypothetical protein